MSVLKIVEIYSSETLADFPQTTRLYNRDDHAFYNHCCENLKSNQKGPAVRALCRGRFTHFSRNKNRCFGYKDPGTSWPPRGVHLGPYGRIAFISAACVGVARGSLRYLYITRYKRGLPRWLKRGTIRCLGTSCRREYSVGVPLRLDPPVSHIIHAV